jgi:hypothetical protein
MTFSLLSLLSLFVGIGLLLYAAMGEAWRFVSELSESGELNSMLSAILRFPHGLLGSSEIAAAWEEKIASTIGAATSSFVSSVLSSMTSAARAVPRILLFLLVSVVSVLYISWDLERVVALLKRVLPRAAREHVSTFKNGFLKTLIGYLRSYGILMLMTFVLVFVGLMILRAEYAVLMVTPENTDADFDRLLSALAQIEQKSPPAVLEMPNIVGGVQKMSIRRAMLAASELIPIDRAVGRICAAPCVSCPPAIPIVVSGEEISAESVDLLGRYGLSCVRVVR